MISVIKKVENFVGQGENAGYQPFPTMFSYAFHYSVIKTKDCVVKDLVFPFGFTFCGVRF